MHFKIISLPNAIERRYQIVRNFKELGINNFEFIEAIDGDSLPDSAITKQLNFDHWRDLGIVKRGYANSLSMIKAIEKAKEDNLKSFILLEDDCVLDFNPYDLILPRSYDVIKFGIGSEFRFIKMSSGFYNHCTMYHSKFYDKTIEYLKSYTDVSDEIFNNSTFFENDIFSFNGIAKQVTDYSYILKENFHKNSPYNPTKLKFNESIFNYICKVWLTSFIRTCWKKLIFR